MSREKRPIANGQMREKGARGADLLERELSADQILRDRLPASEEQPGMLLFASDFGSGRYDLLFGCALLILFPLVELAWVVLQLRGILDADRTSWLSTAFMVLFSFFPGFIVIASVREWRTLNGYSRLLFYLSLSGLILLPVTITMEWLKFLRDRPSRRRRNRR
jgi:hypothetical protein